MDGIEKRREREWSEVKWKKEIESEDIQKSMGLHFKRANHGSSGISYTLLDQNESLLSQNDNVDDDDDNLTSIHSSSIRGSHFKSYNVSKKLFCCN